MCSQSRAVGHPRERVMVRALHPPWRWAAAPVCLSITLAHHPVLTTSGLSILVRIHMDAVVCLWGFLIAFLRCNLDANKKPPV